MTDAEIVKKLKERRDLAIENMEELGHESNLYRKTYDYEWAVFDSFTKILEDKE